MSAEDIVSKLVDFLTHLSGVRWFLIVDRAEKKIVSKSSVIEEGEAEELMDLAINAGDLSDSISKYSLLAGEHPLARTLYLRFDGEGLEIENYDKYIIAMNVDERLVPVLSKIFDMLRKGGSVKCSGCGKDLLLETYTCNRCGRRIPFIAEKCPFCGADLRVKRCPGCGHYIDVNGRIVKRDIGVLTIGILIGFLVLLMSVYMGLTVEPAYRWVFYLFGGIFGILMGILGYVSSFPGRA